MLSLPLGTGLRIHWTACSICIRNVSVQIVPDIFNFLNSKFFDVWPLFTVVTYCVSNKILRKSQIREKIYNIASVRSGSDFKILSFGDMFRYSPSLLYRRCNFIKIGYISLKYGDNFIKIFKMAVTCHFEFKFSPFDSDYCQILHYCIHNFTKIRQSTA